jgi:glycosyltransferase involved in cell wall biosynthesis
MIRKKVFLLYPYYWPFYKAGGPVQSMFNLVSNFADHVDFYVISLDHDVDGSTVPLKNIKAWVKGPNSENIFYTNRISFFLVRRLIRETNPDTVFINGIFNWTTTLPGIVFSRLANVPVIISPRGMLAAWALNIRSTRVKKIFLSLIGLMGAGSMYWHATDSQEKEDIVRRFPRARVTIAPNIPRRPAMLAPLSSRDVNGKIKLVFLSLINSNKNLHLAIGAVIKLKDKFTLDIYGPVSDTRYWESCKIKIDGNAEISYRGSVPPWGVPDVLKTFHFFILPTLGENFGHAIFDSLASGVPVVITELTPWRDLATAGAGFYIEPSETSIVRTLSEISQLNESDYAGYRERSLAYAQNYFAARDLHKEYNFLF